MVERPQGGKSEAEAVYGDPGGVSLTPLGLTARVWMPFSGTLRGYGRLDMPVGVNLGINSDTSHEDAPRGLRGRRRPEVSRQRGLLCHKREFS